MSRTYTDLPATQYPDNIDVFSDKSDINSTNQQYIVDYKRLVDAGDMAAARALIERHNLGAFTITASDFNKLQQAMQAMQRFVKSDKQQIIFSDSQPSGAQQQSVGDVWVKLLWDGSTEVYELTNSGYVKRNLGSSQGSIDEVRRIANSAQSTANTAQNGVDSINRRLGTQVTYSVSPEGVLTITTK